MIIFIIWLTLFLVCFVHINLFGVNFLFILQRVVSCNTVICICGYFFINLFGLFWIIFIIWLTLFLLCFVHINLFGVNFLFILLRVVSCNTVIYICGYFFSNCMQKYKESLFGFLFFVCLCYFELNIYIKYVFVVFKMVPSMVHHYLVLFLIVLDHFSWGFSRAGPLLGLIYGV